MRDFQHADVRQHENMPIVCSDWLAAAEQADVPLLPRGPEMLQVGDGTETTSVPGAPARAGQKIVPVSP